MAAAQVEQDHHRQTPKCTDYPDFAVICSFLSEFSETCGLDPAPIDQLEIMLEENENIYPYLMKMHIKLLRKVLKSVQVDKWEKSLVKFGHTYNSQDAWEIERFGYKKAKIETKLRLLKNLLECQFDYNPKFKVEINKLEANKLRLTPLGRDHEGQNYWYQIDSDANVRVYREDADDETWNLVANDREQLTTLISQLQNGEVKRNVIKNYGQENGIEEEEDDDENEIEISDILLDTGKPPSSTSSEDSSSREAFEKEDSNSNQEIIAVKSKVEEMDIAQTNEIKEDVKSETNTNNIQSSGIKTETDLKPAELKQECKSKEEKEKDLSKIIENKQTLEEINSDSVVDDNKQKVKVNVDNKIKGDQINVDKVPIINQVEKNLDLIKEKGKLIDNTESHIKEELIYPHKDKEQFSLKSEMLLKVTDEMPQDIFDDDESPKELCIDENEVVDSKPIEPATIIASKTLPSKENEKSKALKFEEKPAEPATITATKSLPSNSKEHEKSRALKLEEKPEVKDEKNLDSQKPGTGSDCKPEVNKNGEKLPTNSNKNKIVDSSKSKPKSPVVEKESIIAKSNQELKDKHTTAEVKIEGIKSEPEPVIKENMELAKEISKSKLADSVKKEIIIEQTEVEKVNKPKDKEASNFDKDNQSISAKPDDKKALPGLPNKEKEKAPLSSLVGYEYSSSDDDELIIAEAEPTAEKNTLKRKSSNELDGPTTKSSKIAENEIVGEAIEEELMIVTGEGSGVENQGGNTKSDDDSDDNDDSLDDDSPADDESDPAEVSENDEPKAKPVGRGRGRGRPPRGRGRGRGSGSGRGRGASANQATTTTTVSGGRGRGRGRKRKASSSNDSKTPLNVSLNDPPEEEENRDFEEIHNGSRSSRRSSGRIAVLRVKEEEERRRLEGERLLQLKQAQLTKKQDKDKDQNKAKTAEDSILTTTATKGKKRGRVKGSGNLTTKKAVKFEKNYLPTPSGSDSEPEVVEKGKRGKKGKVKLGKKGKKNGDGGKNEMKWFPDDRSSDEHVDEEEEEHLDEEEEEIIDKSDHEFSPESDLDDEEGSKPSRHARTAKRGEEVDKYSETYCLKCKKGDHPEWILLCDSCDKGYHASCLRPQLWVIPEGNWFCPPCEHKSLVGKFDEYLVEFDKLLKKRENDELRKQRLAFVGISLENILPPVPVEEKKKPDKNNKGNRSRNSRRRRIDSDSADSLLDGDDDDDENLGGFIVNRGENSSSFEESEESEVEDEPIYRLRERKASKGFSLKEYDEMINNAIRDDEDVLGEIQPGVAVPVDENEIVETGAGVVKPEKRKRTGKDIGNGETDSEESEAEKKDSDDDDEEEELNEEDGKENRMKELLKEEEKGGSSGKKGRRKRLNDLDASDDDDNDSDFNGEENDDDDEEELPEDDESEWSGDKDDSDDSIVKSRRFEKSKKQRFGRRETYTESGSVRRSTRRRKAKVKYDDSEDDDGEDEKASGGDNWDSEKEDAPESSVASSVASSDSDWGKRKKKKAPPPPKIRHSLAKFVMDPTKPKRSFGKKGKKKRKRVDEEDIDRAYCNNIGSKAKAKLAEEPARKTRGKLINFKDILESGESDEDDESDAGENIKSKRRRISSESEGESELKIDEDQNQPTSSNKLAESNQKVGESLESPPVLEPQLPPYATKTIPAAICEEEKDIIIPPQMQQPPALFPASSSPNKNQKTKTNKKNDQLLLVSTPILAKQLLDESIRPAAAAADQNPILIPDSIQDNMNMIRIPSPKKEKKDKKSSKKSNQQKQSTGPPPPNPDTSNIQQHLPPNSSPLISHTPHSMPSNPHYQNQPIRPPFHPSWVRPPGSVPPPYSGPTGPQQPMPGHPNSSAFMQMSQQMIRSGYPPPPPRSNDLRMNIFPHYRPPNQTPPPGQHPHQLYNRYPHPPQQMMGGPPPIPISSMNPYPYHFGVPPQGPPHSSPPQTQSQSQPPQPIFSNNPPAYAGGFSRIGLEEEQHAGGTPPPVVSSISQKNEPQNPSEFGGLVSYFSSQRSDDLDS